MEVDDQTSHQTLWEELKQKLCDELTPTELKEVLFLIRKDLCPELDPLWKMEDPLELMTFLENNMTENEAVRILENILSVMSLYGDFGRYDFRKRIEGCRREVHRLRRESRVFREEYFVGRDDEMKSAMDVFVDYSWSKAVWLYGLGGMGKTTLAQEICYRLRHLDSNKHILNVSLKGRTSISDVLRSILTEADRPTSESDPRILEEMTLNLIENIQNDTVILLDNIEDVYMGADNIDTINKFIHTVTECVDKNEYTVRLLVTSRLAVEIKTGDNTSDTRIQEIMVGPLSKQAADSLLRKCIKPLRISADSAQEVLDTICGNCPLAIKLISNQLRNIEALPSTSHVLPDRQITDFVRRINSTMPGMDDCIEYSVRRLDNESQGACKILTVFETSQFSIEDAKSVLKEVKKDIAEVTLVLMYLRHLCILQSCFISTAEKLIIKPPEHDQYDEPETELHYSFHPLVLRCLNKLDIPYDRVKTKLLFRRLLIKKIEQMSDKYKERSSDYLRYLIENSVALNTLIASLADGSVNSNTVLNTKQCSLLYDVSTLIGNHSEQQSVCRRVSEAFSGNPRQIVPCLFWKILEANVCIEEDNYPESEETLASVEAVVNELDTTETERIEVKVEFHLVKSKLRRKQQMIVEATEHVDKAEELVRQCRPECDYIDRLAFVLNAKGTVYFLKKDFDKALAYHQEAYNIIKSRYHDEMNQDLTTYAYNIATIAYAKAKRIQFDADQAKPLYELALARFNFCLETDVKLHIDFLPSYAEKLIMRARVYENLGNLNDALQDNLEVFRRRKQNFGEDHKKTILALYQVARSYFRLRGHEGNARELLIKSMEYYRRMENAICQGGLSFTDAETVDLLRDYERAVTATRNQKEIHHVQEFRMEFREKENYAYKTSSSDSDPSTSTADDADDSADGSSDNSESIHDTLRRDSGYTESVSSADLALSGSLFFPQGPSSDSSVQSVFATNLGNGCESTLMQLPTTTTPPDPHSISPTAFSLSYTNSGSASSHQRRISAQVSQDSVFLPGSLDDCLEDDVNLEDLSLSSNDDPTAPGDERLEVIRGSKRGLSDSD